MFLRFALVGSMACALSVSVAVATDYPDPISLSGGEVCTINVASGTDTYTGAITGEGSIKKTGDGTLVLANDGNTFDGGVEVAGGTLKATKSGAFGSGDVFNSAGVNIRFAAPNGTFDNNIRRSSSLLPTSYSRFIWFFDEDTTLTGDIDLPAQADHQFVTAKHGDGLAASGKVIWTGTTTSKGSLWWEYFYGTYEFRGPIVVSSFRPGSANVSYGRAELYNDQNAISTIALNNTTIACSNANVLGSAKITTYGQSNGHYDLGGFDQTVSALGVYEITKLNAISKTFTGATVKSENEPATLTVTGRGEGTCDTNYLALAGHVALTLDAPGYKQTFTIRQNTTDGKIHVKNGTLELISEASFKNAGALEVDAGAAIVANSTTPSLFDAATNVVVDGSLTCLEGTPAPFGTNAVIALSTDSALTFPAGTTVRVRGLTLNGTPLRGEISAGDPRLPQLKGGSIVVQGADVETADVWTGKAGDASIGADANWQSGEQPDFVSGKFAATFAAADAESFAALVDRNVRFRGLTFSTLDGFEFHSDGTARIFDVGAEGVAVADAEEGHAPVYALDVPVSFKEAQVWNVGAGATFRVAGGSTSPVATSGSAILPSIEKTGDGRLEIAGENVWDGQVVLRACDTVLSGKITTSSGPDDIQITNGNDAQMWEKYNAIYGHYQAGGSLVLSNAVVEKTVMAQFLGDATFMPFRALAGTTNAFNAFFRSVDSSNQGIRILDDAEVVFSGGGRINYAFGMGGTGTAIFRNKTFAAPNGSSGFYVNGGGRAIFEVGNNSLVALTGDGLGANFDLKVDDVLGAAGRHLQLKVASKVDVFSTSQHFSHITATSSELTGEEGSWIVVTNLTTTASTMAKSFLSGAVSYCHAAAGTMTFSNADSTSTGALEVRDGSVVFAADATWATVSNVVVTGTGRLVVNGKPFGKKANLSFGGEGVLSVPTGVTQKFARAFVGDEEIPIGRYSYANAPAALKAHLDSEAGGAISVTGENPGMLMIFR